MPQPQQSAQPRYVEMPNGSYLEWPEGVSAEEFKAKASRIGIAPAAAPPPARRTAVDKMFPTSTDDSPVEIGPPKHREGLEGVSDTFGNMRTRLSQFAQKGIGQGAGDFMTSLPQGLLRILQGQTQMPQHP